jgi:hypothetical protein
LEGLVRVIYANGGQDDDVLQGEIVIRVEKHMFPAESQLLGNFKQLEVSLTQYRHVLSKGFSDDCYFDAWQAEVVIP